MNKEMNIQWYPGHMTKTRRQIEADLKLVDAVCEILDARIPVSSRNPDIAAICGNKPRLVILNRIDMADPAATAAWTAWFRSQGLSVVQTDCKSRQGIGQFVPAVRSILKEKLRRDAEKGQSRPLKIMVVGIPNVGKSTFINQIAGRKGAKAENRPGVTLNKQWVSTDIGLELLDMPGVLWPKFEEKRVGENLALTGAIKDKIMDTEELAMILCTRLRTLAPAAFAARYKLTDEDGYTDMDAYDLFELIGKKRGFLMAGGVVNHERTADMLLGEFRSATIGQVSLEAPKSYDTRTR